MFDKHYVGRHITAFEDNRKKRPISRVTLMVDDENALTAGDDTGMELLASCPHATQGMVDAILAQVKGYEYHMYSGDAAEIDPAAELGDGVNVNGIYSVISRMSEGGRGYTGLSAPGEPEMEDEYPAEGPLTTEFNRKIAQTNSRITKTAEEIRLEVENELEGLSASFSVQLNSITSRVQGVEGRVSSIDQYVGSITLSVSNGSTSSIIKLMAGDVEIASQNITMSGLVTFTGLANGTTTIDGGCIKTGTIEAERLNLTGAITFSDLSSSVQNDIDDAYNTANDAYSLAEDAESLAMAVDDTVGGWTYPGTTYIDGEMLMTGTVKASSLQGGEVVLLDANEREAGLISLEGAASYSGQKVVISSGAIELQSIYGDLYLISGDGANIQLSGEVVLGGGDTRPDDISRSCGTSDAWWSDVYTENDPVVVSDLTKKKEVIYDLSAYESVFDALKPMSFLFVDGDSGRRHIGLGAQDVLDVLTGAGLTTQDFAGFVAAPKRDEAGQLIEGEYDYFLRYGEFVPLCIDQIQKLKQRVSALEGTA